MRTPYKKAFILFLLVIPMILPVQASACACCSNWGAWFENNQQLDGGTLEELARLKLSGSAKLFLTDGPEPEGISLSSPWHQDFTVSLSRLQSQWTIVIKGNKGETGSLTLSLPKTAVIFGADLQDGVAGSGGGPVLYKELRLEGPVSGRGIFAKGVTVGTRFRLVLQGRGNNCTNAEDFKSWNLQVSGRRAKFSFYGSFDPPGSGSNK